MPFVASPPLPGWLEPALPLTRRAYALERGPDAGRVMHMIDHGQGPPVLLLHGNPTWSFLWREVIRRLPGRRCVAPDLLGFGLSSKLPRSRDHQVERHLAALDELFVALGLAGADAATAPPTNGAGAPREGVLLVGQDWGGPLVVGLAARHPGRVAGLVLGNTSVLVPSRPRGTLFHRFARAPLVSQVAFRLLGFPLRSLHWSQGDPASIRGQVARAYRWPLSRVRDRAGPLGLARMVPSSPDHPSVAALRPGAEWVQAFAGPVHLVWGEKDPILGRALAKHVAALPRAVVTRTQAGHFLQEEVPDLLAAAVQEVGARAEAAAAARV
ncbi:MAG: alpha/beta fold hydrolase [Planctomycetes bacterium]|nr:alpha/beta fold hydrolase [Planctomycetota bacterium]